MRESANTVCLRCTNLPGIGIRGFQRGITFFFFFFFALFFCEYMRPIAQAVEYNSHFHLRCDVNTAKPAVYYSTVSRRRGQAHFSSNTATTTIRTSPRPLSSSFLSFYRHQTAYPTLARPIAPQKIPSAQGISPSHQRRDRRDCRRTQSFA